MSILSKNLKHLRETMPYLKALGVLETVIKSPSILTLTLDDIKERKSFIETIGGRLVDEGRFNPIFGVSKKKYQMLRQRVEEQNKNRCKSVDKV